MTVWIRASLVDEDCDLRFAFKQWRKYLLGACSEHDQRQSDCEACAKKTSYTPYLRKLGNHIGAAVGNAGHRIFQAQLEFKLKTGHHPSILHGYKESKKQLYKECAEGMEYDTQTTKDRIEAALQIEAMTRTFNAEYLPTVKSAKLNDGRPVIEQELQMWWDEKQTILVTGRPDHATVSGDVDDFKTGVREPVQPKQAGIQTEILDAHGFPVKRNRTVWFNRRTADLKIITYDTKVVREAADYRIRNLVRDFHAMKKEKSLLVFNTNPKSFSCKPEFCPGYGTPACALKQHEVIEK